MVPPKVSPANLRMRAVFAVVFRPLWSGFVMTSPTPPPKSPNVAEPDSKSCGNGPEVPPPQLATCVISSK